MNHPPDEQRKLLSAFTSDELKKELKTRTAERNHKAYLAEKAKKDALDVQRGETLGDISVLLRNGMTTKAISEKLGISRAAVEYRSRSVRVQAAKAKEAAALKELMEKGDKKALLQRPVLDMPFSYRSRNALQQNGIHTIEQLISKSPTELLRTKNFGRRSLRDIEGVLHSVGLSLGNS